MQQLLEANGIAFEPAEDYLQTLQRAGAKEEVVQTLRAARPQRMGATKAAAPEDEVLVQHLVRAAQLMNQRDRSGAEPEFRAALRRAPETAVLHLALGTSLTKPREPDAAIAEFREALRLQPDLAEAHFRLGAALTHKDLNAALAELHEAVRLVPNDPAMHELLGGELLFSVKDPAAAVPELREAARLDPKADRLALALALEQTGQLQAALEEYQGVLQLEPKNSKVRASIEKLSKQLKKK